jgi:hypothetical protein
MARVTLRPLFPAGKGSQKLLDTKFGDLRASLDVVAKKNITTLAGNRTPVPCIEITHQNMMKFSRAISRVKWLSDKKTNVSKIISVLVLRVLDGLRLFFHRSTI